MPPPDLQVTSDTDPIFGNAAFFYLKGNGNGWNADSTKWEYQ